MKPLPRGDNAATKAVRGLGTMKAIKRLAWTYLLTTYLPLTYLLPTNTHVRVSQGNIGLFCHGSRATEQIISISD